MIGRLYNGLPYACCTAPAPPDVTTVSVWILSRLAPRDRAGRGPTARTLGYGRPCLAAGGCRVVDEDRVVGGDGQRVHPRDHFVLSPA